MRHGRGAAKHRDRGFYRGYFAHDMFHGKGELHFSRRRTRREKAEAAAAAAAAEADEGVADKMQGRDRGNAFRGKEAGGGLEDKDTDKDKDKDRDAPPADNRAEFRKAFYGYFIADDVANGGIVVDSETLLTRNTSRRNTQLLAPIINIRKKMKKTVQRLRKQIEKFTFMELYVRNDITRKKTRIFRQQRHMTKKTMYALDRRDDLLDTGEYDSDGEEAEELNLNVPDQTLEKVRVTDERVVPRAARGDAIYRLPLGLSLTHNRHPGPLSHPYPSPGPRSPSPKSLPWGLSLTPPPPPLTHPPLTARWGKELIRERLAARRYRLENTDLDKVRPSKPLVPRLGVVSTDQQTHVSKVVTSVTTDPETGDFHRVKRMLPRVAASDFEEAAERQRYLKYDLIWARAEEAFAMKRRSAADEAEAT